MMTVEEFEGLAEGDLIEAVPLFATMAPDALVILQTAKVVREEGKHRAEFVVTYVGITLGRWACEKKEGALEWLVA